MLWLAWVMLWIADIKRVTKCVFVCVFNSFRVDGGVAGNDFLVQMMSDTVDQVIERSRHSDMSCLGAAFLAGLAKGKIIIGTSVRTAGCCLVFMTKLWQKHALVWDLVLSSLPLESAETAYLLAVMIQCTCVRCLYVNISLTNTLIVKCMVWPVLPRCFGRCCCAQS